MYQWEEQGLSEEVPIDNLSSAVLISAQSCNGGNGLSQYLVIYKNGTAVVVARETIGDMKFLAHKIFVQGRNVVLNGPRWLSNDPHCCASAEGVFVYNIDTGVHTLKSVARNGR